MDQNPSYINDRIILGIDPGTNVMGYGVIQIIGKRLNYVAMGVVDLRKIDDPYLKIKKIFNETTRLIEQYLPDEFAIEAQFFGKNVQSMLKLGRAQGVAIAAALQRDLPICEYAPLKIKMAITGNGASSKEQVAKMLQNILKFPKEDLETKLDATDALAVALCHYYETNSPVKCQKFTNWNDFVQKNAHRIHQKKKED